VFDRTAASYLGLRRNQTGGLGNPQVDPLIRAAIDLSGEVKSRSSTWIAPTGALPSEFQAGDILYFGLEAGSAGAEFTDPHLRAWRIRTDGWFEIDESTLEGILWDTEWSASRKAGELASADSLWQSARGVATAGKLHFPIAAIGIRERGERG